MVKKEKEVVGTTWSKQEKPLISPKIKLMDTNTESKVNRKAMWLLFLVFTVITVGLVIFNPTWFWVPLPFMLTFLVYAMDVV